MRLGLLGKKYKDTTYHVSSFVNGETNEILKTSESLGGMYNIAKANIGNLTPICYPEGEKQALILEDVPNSTRTSFCKDISDRKIRSNTAVNTRHPDWLHVMYIDDIKSAHRVTEYHNNFNKFPTSIDFCTDTPRKKYELIMQRCDLVFDSRERRHLYDDISIATPIVLHDEFGCEVLIIGGTSFKCENTPVKNLEVNGAGDIFAAYFIRETYHRGIEHAVETACSLTTEHLLRKNYD